MGRTLSESFRSDFNHFCESRSNGRKKKNCQFLENIKAKLRDFIVTRLKYVLNAFGWLSTSPNRTVDLILPAANPQPYFDTQYNLLFAATCRVGEVGGRSPYILYLCCCNISIAHKPRFRGLRVLHSITRAQHGRMETMLGRTSLYVPLLYHFCSNYKGSILVSFLVASPLAYSWRLYPF